VSRGRQKLFDRLAARGLAPAAAAAALAIGSAAGPAAVPTTLLHTTCSTLLAGATAVPAPVLQLARTATEGSVLKSKLLAAGVLIVAGMTLTGGAARLGEATAQGPPSTNPPTTFTDPRFQPAYTQTTAPSSRSSQWEYRFEPFAVNLDEFKKKLAARGKEGWEYAGTEVFEGQETRTVVFKRPVTHTATAPVTYGMNPNWAPTMSGPSSVASGLPAPTNKAADGTAVLRVGSEHAASVAATLSEIFNGPGKGEGRVLVTADAKANQVVVHCSPMDAVTIIQLLAKTNLANRIDMDLTPGSKPYPPTGLPPTTAYGGPAPSVTTPLNFPGGPTTSLPSMPGGNPSLGTIDAPFPFPVPKGISGETASRVAKELAKTAGLSVSAGLSEDAKVLYLSGPAGDVEKVHKSLTAVLGALKEAPK
jgi:hypothetical protein